MTMVRRQRGSTIRNVRAAGIVMKTALVVLCWSGSLLAQVAPPVHLQHAGILPPGAIGRLRLERGGPLSGYFQPVEIRAPEGALISMAEQGAFQADQPSPALVGLQIGPVYRFRVTRIPNNPGAEVFPTVEIVDRLYPPQGEATRFPIPVALTQTELQLALEGRFVTRVIYLEDPSRALPHQDNRSEQLWFEAAPGQDPLQVADQLGRPVAILRIGGRVPDPSGPTPEFLYGSPPVMRFVTRQPAEVVVPAQQ